MSAAATTLLAALLGVALALCAWVYVGYPALLLVLSRLWPRPVRRGQVTPGVTLIVAAHDEAALIGAKVRNALGLRYPADRLQVIVASDGSTDDTVARARAAAVGDPRVRVLDLPRRGKAHALNAAAALATTEVLAFTDANIYLAPDSLSRLVESFADPEVGGVCAHKAVVRRARDGAIVDGEGLYWRWDQWQKAREAEIGSVLASDGALHAVRRALFVPIGDPAAADDMAISVRVPLQGARLAIEPRAQTLELAAEDPAEEFRRKIRVTNAGLRALLDLRGRLWRSGWYSFELISHKLLRTFVPVLLAVALAASVPLAPVHPAFALLLALQLALYALALAGHLLRDARAGRWMPLAVPYYFCLVNVAALCGILSLLRGVRFGIWVPRSGLQS